MYISDLSADRHALVIFLKKKYLIIFWSYSDYCQIIAGWPLPILIIHTYGITDFLDDLLELQSNWDHFSDQILHQTNKGKLSQTWNLPYASCKTYWSWTAGNFTQVVDIDVVNIWFLIVYLECRYSVNTIDKKWNSK